MSVDFMELEIEFDEVYGARLGVLFNDDLVFHWNYGYQTISQIEERTDTQKR